MTDISSTNNDIVSEEDNIIENNDDTLDNNNEEDSTDSESDSDSYLGSDFDSNETYYGITHKPESEQYIIVKDNRPIGYAPDLDKAQQYMWSIARTYKSMVYYNYFTYIRELEENCIQIMGKNRFMLLRYDCIFSTFEIYRIKQLVDNVCTKVQSSCTNDDCTEQINNLSESYKSSCTIS